MKLPPRSLRKGRHKRLFPFRVSGPVPSLGYSQQSSEERKGRRVMAGLPVCVRLRTARRRIRARRQTVLFRRTSDLLACLERLLTDPEVRACVCARVRACVRACVRICVFVCAAPSVMRACIHALRLPIFSLIARLGFSPRPFSSKLELPTGRS